MAKPSHPRHDADVSTRANKTLVMMQLDPAWFQHRLLRERLGKWVISMLAIGLLPLVLIQALDPQGHLLSGLAVVHDATWSENTINSLFASIAVVAAISIAGILESKNDFEHPHRQDGLSTVLQSLGLLSAGGLAFVAALLAWARGYSLIDREWDTEAQVFTLVSEISIAVLVAILGAGMFTFSTVDMPSIRVSLVRHARELRRLRTRRVWLRQLLADPTTRRRADAAQSTWWALSLLAAVVLAVSYELLGIRFGAGSVAASFVLVTMPLGVTNLGRGHLGLNPLANPDAWIIRLLIGMLLVLGSVGTAVLAVTYGYSWWLVLGVPLLLAAFPYALWHYLERRIGMPIRIRQAEWATGRSIQSHLMKLEWQELLVQRLATED